MTTGRVMTTCNIHPSNLQHPSSLFVDLHLQINKTNKTVTQTKFFSLRRLHPQTTLWGLHSSSPHWQLCPSTVWGFLPQTSGLPYPKLGAMHLHAFLAPCTFLVMPWAKGEKKSKSWQTRNEKSVSGWLQKQQTEKKNEIMIQYGVTSTSH